MQEVAHHLQVQAHKETEERRDAFARSAYNRYYYASFLRARELVHRIFPERNEELGHASYPEFLEGKVLKKLQEGQRRADRTGDHELSGILNKAKFATLSLSQQFRKANAVRITADYYPEKYIEFSGKARFSLESINISEAHNWIKQTEQFAQVIESAWNQMYAT